MTPEVAVLAIAMGLLFGLVCYLATNLSPGGMITPGWLALLLLVSLEQLSVLTGVVIVTYAGVRLLRRVVILYGKRLFATVVAVAVFIQVGFVLLLLHVLPESVAPWLHTVPSDATAFGFIVPGLIVYQFFRQPVVATFAGIAVVTAVTYVVIVAGLLLHLFRGGETGADALGDVATVEAHPVQLAAAALVAVAGVAVLSLQKRAPAVRAPEARRLWAVPLTAPVSVDERDTRKPATLAPAEPAEVPAATRLALDLGWFDEQQRLRRMPPEALHTGSSS